jgi:hypothetical protein
MAKGNVLLLLTIQDSTFTAVQDNHNSKLVFRQATADDLPWPTNVIDVKEYVKTKALICCCNKQAGCCYKGYRGFPGKN